MLNCKTFKELSKNNPGIQENHCIFWNDYDEICNYPGPDCYYGIQEDYSSQTDYPIDENEIPDFVKYYAICDLCKKPIEKESDGIKFGPNKEKSVHSDCYY